MANQQALTVVEWGDEAILGAAMNTFNVLDGSALTSIRQVYPADGGALGDVLVFYVKSECDAPYNYYIRSGSGTINGVDHSVTPWSMIWQAGEIVRLINIGSNTWWVEQDGRIPAAISVYRSTDLTVNSASTWTNIDFDTVQASHALNNRGTLWDTTSKTLITRRDSAWEFGLAVRPYTIDYNQHWSGRIAGLSKDRFAFQTAGATVSAIHSLLSTVGWEVPAATTLTPMFYSTQANSGVLGGGGSDTYFNAREILTRGG